MAREKGEAVERPPSEDEDRDRYLGIMKRKRGGKAKKKFPFHAKVTGGSARRRPDRRAVGGATGEPIPPDEPAAPVGGKVEQKFQDGGGVSNEEIGEAQRQMSERKRKQNAEINEADKSFFNRRPPTEIGGMRIGPEGYKGERQPRGGLFKAGGHITTAQRKALPSSEFALPGKGKGAGGKGPGSYPVDTPGRARAALSRGKANASPSQFATIKRKVKAEYPGMKVS